MAYFKDKGLVRVLLDGVMMRRAFAVFTVDGEDDERGDASTSSLQIESMATK